MSADHTGPTIGVVVPAYNAASFMDQALASVAGQGRPADRIVVVDDGSSDGTGAKAARWCPILPLEVVVHDRNRGLAASRRTAIEHLDTDLVALLDADDVWLPDHLGLMLETYLGSAGLVTADALRWMPNKMLGLRRAAHDIVVPEDQQLVRLIKANYVFVGTLFSRELYEKVGGFRDGFPGAEDWDLWLRMVRSGVTVRRCPEPTVLYRVHPASMSHGYVLVPNEVKVLMALENEVHDRELRRVITAASRDRRARIALATAYDHARRDRTGRARSAALVALTYGSPAVKVRAASTALLPRWSVARRDALANRPDRRVSWH